MGEGIIFFGKLLVVLDKNKMKPIVFGQFLSLRQAYMWGRGRMQRCDQTDMRWATCSIDIYIYIIYIMQALVPFMSGGWVCINPGENLAGVGSSRQS